MNEKDFQNKLDELLLQINDLPEDKRAPLLELAEETKTRHEKIRQTIKSLQDSVDYLRLGVKYLVFDLEATRRENEQLRTMLRGPGANPNINNDHASDNDAEDND
ncbi:MAG: transcriptional regulator [Phycisphaerales bacterium]